MRDRQYEVFHGKRPLKKGMVNFHVPKKLIQLGKAVAIEYECTKKNGGGTGRREVYRHEFETGEILCMDERCKNQLYIIGNKLFVSKAGIEK